MFSSASSWFVADRRSLLFFDLFLPPRPARPLLGFAVLQREHALETLETLGVRTLGELGSLTETQLLACKNFGQTSLMEIKKKLEAYGLGLRAD